MVEIMLRPAHNSKLCKWKNSGWRKNPRDTALDRLEENAVRETEVQIS